MMNLKYPLILASKSPRRQDLLRQAGIQFTVQTKETDEDFPPSLPPLEVAKFLAEKKAEAFRQELDHQLVLTADTTVVVDQQILNKPESNEEATQMLRMISGRSHKVVSGVCLLQKDQKWTFDDTTEVFFRELDEKEIAWYIKEYQPFDKAGSYGIQEWIGLIGVEKIVGSYFTVMGLPIHKIYAYLKSFQTN